MSPFRIIYISRWNIAGVFLKPCGIFFNCNSLLFASRKTVFSLSSILNLTCQKPSLRSKTEKRAASPKLLILSSIFRIWNSSSSTKLFSLIKSSVNDVHHFCFSQWSLGGTKVIYLLQSYLVFLVYLQEFGRLLFFYIRDLSRPTNYLSLGDNIRQSIGNFPCSSFRSLVNLYPNKIFTLGSLEIKNLLLQLCSCIIL